MAASDYTLSDFVAELGAALSSALPEAARLEAGARALARLLANPRALDAFRPALAHGRGPWTLYTDPAHGFVVTLLLKPHGGTTPVHHHGEAWTLYGIVEGVETIHRYERVDGAPPRHVADHVRRAGEVEIEPAFAIHNETTSSGQDTLALAVRGCDLAATDHEWFDLATGQVTRGRGQPGRPLPPPLG